MSDKNLKIDNDQAGRRIDNYLLNIFKDLLVSSHRILSEFFNTFSALNVISSKLPIGVETIYKPDKKLFINYEKNF